MASGKRRARNDWNRWIFERLSIWSSNTGGADGTGLFYNCDNGLRRWLFRLHAGDDSADPLRELRVAPSFLFLACEDASYMIGQVLHPDGGDSTSS